MASPSHRNFFGWDPNKHTDVLCRTSPNTLIADKKFDVKFESGEEAVS